MIATIVISVLATIYLLGMTAWAIVVTIGFRTMKQTNDEDYLAYSILSPLKKAWYLAGMAFWVLLWPVSAAMTYRDLKAQAVAYREEQATLSRIGEAIMREAEAAQAQDPTRWN